MTVIELTDDEVAALAVDRQGAWPSGLPTVDISSAENLGAAVFRGQRSLLVRGLLDEGVPVASLQDVADIAVDAPDYLLVYLSDQELERASWGIASTHYRGSWLLETVTPVGVHRLETRPRDEHQAYVRALVAAALVEGPADDEAVPYALAVASIARGAVTVLQVRRDSSVLVRRDPATGAVLGSDAVALSDVDALLEKLI